MESLAPNQNDGLGDHRNLAIEDHLKLANGKHTVWPPFSRMSCAPFLCTVHRNAKNNKGNREKEDANEMHVAPLRSLPLVSVGRIFGDPLWPVFK
jgi:hypothetical protein